MRRVLHRLTAREVETLHAPGLHADGGGLYLKVDPSGAKRWTFVFFTDKRRREKGLGAFPQVSLRAARDAAAELRRSVRDGHDPLAAKKAAPSPLAPRQEIPR